MPTLSRRGGATAVLAALTWSVLGIGAADHAAAHTELESSSPANGALLKHSPTQAKLTFSESVTPIRDKFVLRGAGGSPVEIGRVKRAGDSVIVPIKESLENGTYLLSYGVISDDGHAVKGGLAFRVQQ
ncbi:MAG TPA: copper resistance CopC family protein [Sporichthyaceae bacterium]|jgi:methionine-rich copper-binding protein CopC